jgi:hypothetical protein
MLSPVVAVPGPAAPQCCADIKAGTVHGIACHARRQLSCATVETAAFWEYISCPMVHKGQAYSKLLVFSTWYDNYYYYSNLIYLRLLLQFIPSSTWLVHTFSPT